MIEWIENTCKTSNFVLITKDHVLTCGCIFCCWNLAAYFLFSIFQSPIKSKFSNIPNGKCSQEISNVIIAIKRQQQKNLPKKVTWDEVSFYAYYANVPPLSFYPLWQNAYITYMCSLEPCCTFSLVTWVLCSFEIRL